MSSTPKETSTTSTQKVELPAWVDQGGQENYDLAKNIATTPYQAYTGALTAGSDNAYTAAARRNVQMGQTSLDNGLGQSNDLASWVATQGQPKNAGLRGYQPSTVTSQQVGAPTSVKDIFASSIGKGDIANYMNPYEDDVVKSAQLAGDQSIAMSQRSNSDAAIAAGAFGSSRHGVTEGVTAAQGAQDIASTVGSIRSAGFNTALSAAQADAGRKDAASMANQNKDMSFQDLLARVGIANQGADLSAQTANQGALAQRAGMQLSADQGNQTALGNYNNQVLASGQQMAANASTSANNRNSLAAFLQGQGMNYQAYDQKNLDSNYQQWQQAKDYPTEQLNLRLAALGMTPYGKTTTGSGTSTESGGDNPFMTFLGGAMGVKNLFSFSDPKLKKNVRTEGTGTAGMKVKSFEYRDDTGLDLPKGRQIGYMADEVERKMPGAVRRVPIGDGRTARQVDYGQTGVPGVFGFSKRKVAA